MKSGYVAVVLICAVFISIPQFGVCQSKHMLLAQQGASSAEDIARSQADLDRIVREHFEMLAQMERAGNRPAVAQLFNRLGMVYLHHGRYEQAEKCFEKAYSIARQIGDVGTEVNALINLGLVSMNTGKYERAVKKYDKVRDLARRINNPSLDAMVNHNLGLLYSQWGKPEKSAQHYEKSIALRRKMHDMKWEAITSLNLGEVYMNIGKQDKALHAFENAQSLLEQLQQSREIKVGRAAALSRLAIIHTAKARYAKAVECLETCQSLAKECNDLQTLAEAFALLANVHYYRGQYKEAERCGNEAVKLKVEQNDKRGLASALGNLGILYSSIGEYGQATDYFQKALKVAEEVHDDKGKSGMLTNLGTVCADRGQYNEAIEHLNRALDLCKATQYAENEAVVRGNIARLYQDQGRYDKATEHYESALSFFESQGRENDRAIVLFNLGRIREAEGDQDGALARYEQGLRIFEKIKVPTNWPNKLIGDVYLDKGELQKAEQYLNRAKADSSLGRLCLLKSAHDRAKVHYRKILETGEKNRNADALFTAHTGLGLAYEGMGQLQQAADHFRKAAQYTEQLRTGVNLSERERFLDVKVGGFSRTTPYEGLARVLMKMNKPLDALNRSEFTKARVFAESMAGKIQSSALGVPPEVMKRDSLLKDQWAKLTKNLEVAYEKLNKDAIDNLESQKKDLGAKMAEHISELRNKYPLFAACRYPQPPDLSQTALKDHEWVLSFDVTDLGVIVYLTRGKSLVKSLFKPIPRKKVDQMVKRFRESFEGVTRDNGGEKLEAFDFVAGKQLSDLLLADVLPELPKDAPVIVVPDDSLGVLPFEMLVLNDRGKIEKKKEIPCTANAEFFGDRNPISYSQSITALTLIRTFGKGKSTARKTLVMDDPVFTTDDPRLQQMAKARKSELLESAPKSLLMSIMTLKKLDFPRLPLTKQLGDFMVDLDSKATTRYTGLKAQKRVLFDTALDKYKSMVFATHGYFGKDLPGIQEPVLVLTLLDQPKDEDGFLRLSEVMDLKLNADMVALTACQTGLGKIVSGEGTMGMGRAFQHAGAKSVLMSLWTVSENTSVKLVETFFKHLKEGKTRLEALRLARQEVRRDGYDHPFFWAPFILVGEVR